MRKEHNRDFFSLHQDGRECAYGIWPPIPLWTLRTDYLSDFMDRMQECRECGPAQVRWRYTTSTGLGHQNTQARIVMDLARRRLLNLLHAQRTSATGAAPAGS